MSSEDTIAAIATPSGRGGVAIVRVSGSLALEVIRRICEFEPTPRTAYFKKFRINHEILDEGVVLFFKSPHSYTGEDIAEFQGHAGSIAPQRVLNAILSIKGVRMAEPGEFTRRAFLNNKMDLTAAEAVEDLISAGSYSAAKAALSSLEGTFSDRVNDIVNKVTDFRVHLEACLDFPEEHEDFFDSGKYQKSLQNIIEKLKNTLLRAEQGVKLTEGARIVLAGEPNAGKSSLMNALAGVDKAIVTNIPGTTRDIITAEMEIHGIPVTITDTAGLRDNPDDAIEAIGIEKAENEVKKADLILFMIDGSSAINEQTLSTFKKVINLNKDLIIVVSKTDKPLYQENEILLSKPPFDQKIKIKTSTKTENGLDALKAELIKALGIIQVEGVFSARQRHLSSLTKALDSLKRAYEIVNTGDLVLCAQEMREAQNHLGEITGKVTSDDIIGKIFSSFCIGK